MNLHLKRKIVIMNRKLFFFDDSSAGVMPTSDIVSLVYSLEK